MIVGMEAGSEEEMRAVILVCQTGSQRFVQIAPDFDFNAGDVPVRIRVWDGVRGKRVIVSLLSKVHLDVAAGRKKEIRTPVIRLPSIEKLIRIGGPDRSVHPFDASIGKLGLRIEVKQTMQHALRRSAPSRVQELGCVTQTIFRTPSHLAEPEEN